MQSREKEVDAKGGEGVMGATIQSSQLDQIGQLDQTNQIGQASQLDQNSQIGQLNRAWKEEEGGVAVVRMVVPAVVAVVAQDRHPLGVVVEIVLAPHQRQQRHQPQLQHQHPHHHQRLLPHELPHELPPLRPQQHQRLLPLLLPHLNQHLPLHRHQLLALRRVPLQPGLPLRPILIQQVNNHGKVVLAAPVMRMTAVKVV